MADILTPGGSVVVLSALFACSPSPPCAEGYGRLASGVCVALDDGSAPDVAAPDETGASVDTSPPTDGGSAVDTSPPTAFELGDPLTTLGTDGRYDQGSSENPWGAICHLTDAEVIDAEYGLAVCDVGVAVIGLGDGQYVTSATVAYQVSRLAYDASTRTAWLATRDAGLYPVDLSDPTAPVSGAQVVLPDHEDVAADAGRVLLAARGEGVLLLDGHGAQVSSVGATEALAVALEDDTALVVDGEELILYRLDQAFEELDRVDLGSKGRDLDLQGDRVAVALGGAGAAVYSIDGGSLVYDGDVPTPGPSYGVALDGDHLLASGWYATVLAWIGDGEPRVLGHEDAVQWSMGVGALDGRVLVADWFYSAALQIEPGLAGPEIVVEEGIWVVEGEESVAVTFENAGIFDLEVSVGSPAGGSSSPDALTVAPGSAEAVVVTLPDGFANQTSLTWTSDDPDEPEGELRIDKGSQTLGTEHVDFELLGYTPPSTLMSSYALADYRGQVVFLAYFSVT